MRAEVGRWELRRPSSVGFADTFSRKREKGNVMNYRHAFHAGNFADVFKHAFLTRLFAYLVRKETALRFIDTHAGAGRYDLDSEAARRSPEWRDGVARLLKARPQGEVAQLLAPYLRAIGPFDEEHGRPLSYPGSPALAQALLRPQDRIALCEAHDEERERLVAALGRDRRLSIVGTDGYIALNAYVPPKERRGLVLIDPPYEAPEEAETRRGGAVARADEMAARHLSRLAADQGRKPRMRGFFPASRRWARRTSFASKSTSARSSRARIRRRRCGGPACSSSIRRST